MSRLVNYINEEHSPETFYNILTTECNEYLDEIDTIHTPGSLEPEGDTMLWRGTNHKVTDYVTMIPRIDRRPRDSSQWVHDYMDEQFHDKFGWKTRSEGVFAGSEKQAGEFGNYTYIILPVNGYKYVWSPIVDDLYANLGEYGNDFAADYIYDKIDMNDWKRLPDVTKAKYYDNDENVWYDDQLGIEQEKWFDSAMELINKLVATYKTSGLKGAIDKDREVMFKCSKYYLVDFKWYRDLWNTGALKQT